MSCPHQEHSPKHSTFKTSAHATLHCLTGCAIGEVLGLIIGVSIGLSPWQTMLLGTLLAFIIGISLAVHPIMKNEGFTWQQAFGVIWLGEVVSITVMEIAMNAVDYWMGGVMVNSITEPLFWTSILAAIPAGYLAAWPVNHWLLSRSLKKCH